MYLIFYHKKVVQEDIPRLGENTRRAIKKAIETRLTEMPELYGKPLRKSLAGYRKLRVGNYRVIFKIRGMEVRILIIAHRKEVYALAEARGGKES